MSEWENAAAKEFDLWSLSGRADGMESGHSHGAENILASWAIDSSSRVLDVGCGQGWLLRRIIQSGAGFGVGVDVSEEMIRFAQNNAVSKERYLVASASDLPFETGQFSHLISIESLYYHTDPSSSLREWRRVGQNNATLGIMVDLYKENIGSHAWVDALNIPVHLLSIRDYVQLIEQSGWTNVQVQQVVDPRPVTPKSDFKPSAYYPSYSQYLAYRKSGSLVLKATG